MANEKTPVVWDDTTKKHRPLGTGEKMGGLSASSIISSDSGNLIGTGSDGLAYLSGSGIADPAAGNLIEATAQGKLKLDADRLAEWLDGHPADAKALAEALNVVSGDSGNVITKGSDKGAYLSSAQLASAVGSLTDAQRQALAAALADGKTIVASSGKLTVDPTSATAAQLTNISTALRKSGGGLSVGADGKLSVDFASMSSSTLSALIASIIQSGGGLAQDEQGRLYVDFDAMDDTKFRNMMQGFIDKQTLKSAGGANHFYVDGSDGSDSGLDSREDPGSPADPFRTIQACVDYITKIYKFASTNAYIECQNVSQTTPLSLPSFDRTTAEITIRGASFNSSTSRSSPSTLDDYSIEIVVSPTSGSRHALSISGTGVWHLSNFHVTVSDSALTGGGGHLSAFHLSGYATASISRCKFETHRDVVHPWQYSKTTGEHVVYLTDYSHLYINGYNYVIGSDLALDPTVITSDQDAEHAGTYHRELNGFSVSDSSQIDISDTRDLTGSGGADKRLVFSGNFELLVGCSSKISRNRVYMGATNTTSVANANYRFYISGSGAVNITDSGKIDADHNDDDATDTWLGTVTTNADGTGRKSYVSTYTYAWYD